MARDRSVAADAGQEARTTAGPVRSLQHSAHFLDIVAQRLRAAAGAALVDPPTPLATRLQTPTPASQPWLSNCPRTVTPPVAWLVLTALAGAYPLAAGIRFALRAVDLHGPSGLTLALLDRARTRTGARGCPDPPELSVRWSST
jgi:hypothetical protein